MFKTGLLSDLTIFQTIFQRDIFKFDAYDKNHIARVERWKQVVNENTKYKNMFFFCY